MAKLTEKLASWFRSSKADEENYYDEEPAAPGNIIQNFNSPTTEKSSEATNTGEISNKLGTDDTSAYEQVIMPYWLEDEDTLRDEGVLFGLSESEPSEKTEIIQKYFSQLGAPHAAEIEQQNERIQELNLFIGQKSNRMDELGQKLRAQSDLRFTAEHHLPRTLMGLLLCVAMCAGNFYLIRASLKPAFEESSAIAIGVFLSGMFSLFGRISMFHDNDSKVTWRALLEEIGLPFAAALFVFTNALPYQTFWQAMALFIFVFFLFLFAGKLLLSNITLLRNDLKAWLGMRKESGRYEQNQVSWENEIRQLQNEIDELRIKKWQSLREQSTAETERDRINAKRDMLVKLFESEFYLARRMKTELTGRQIRYIRDSSRD
ncbi:hypothetical protein DYBT9275_00325 [Dyadobacter sp. CECT 9275]|uniref:Uncharacterized protein n=1 Tax=Dyadobacter helix TaxID=2822344 RepID=A0A916J9U5_9BACT|nr:hypothetical protein [Dyadobacter sp. CECT 9275]CAG4989603.1 hypothetical protein DYBT9275_00325 [Dyadobacter sp. CECT 9275]